jgi:hypothetical protein
MTVMTGCACPEKKAVVVTKVEHKCPPPANTEIADLPRDAKPGECFAKVFVPPQFKTVSERVCVREASETLEIVPAEYEWVEERVCIKDASSQLIEVPARFVTDQIVVQTDSGYTGWTVNKDCPPPKDQPTKDVFCLVKHPPKTETVCVTRMAAPPTVKEEIIPAQFEMVKRQKLVRPATTRRVCIPAEYSTVEKRVKVCDGRMVWQRVQCKMPEAVAINLDGKLEMRNLNADFEE